MTALNNKVGPTRVWKTMNGRNVKSNDGKDLGKIKKISKNYLLLQKGKVRKHRFWIPKYIADAFDGKTLWLLLSEEEVRGKYQYGKEPPTGEKYSTEFESFKGTPFGQKAKYRADFEENIRIVENYNNIRDLHQTTSFEDESKYLKTPRQGHGLKPRSEDEQIHAQQEIESSEVENERKEKNKQLEAEGVPVTGYFSKQPIKFGSPKTLERTVQPFPPFSKSAGPKIGAIKNANDASSGPIRFQPSQITERLEEVTKDGGRKKSINANSTDLSPVKRTSEAHVPIQSVATTPTAIAHSSVMSSGSSSQLPIHTTDKHKETIPNLSALDLGSTQMPMNADDNTVSNSTTESTAVMVATSTYITTDKMIDTMPVLVDPVPKLAKVKEEQHIIAVPNKNNESNLPALNIQTLTPSSLETESNSSNPISIYSDPKNQLTSRNAGRTNMTKNVNPILDYYFNPFLATWQECLDIYNEFAAIGIRLSLNWFELLWKLGTPTIPSAIEIEDNNKV
jgi:hypothetical protein